MAQIIITPLTSIGSDNRGTGYEWETFRTGTFILCYRNAGSSSGQHYHEGHSDYKNPEIVYLLSGKVLLHWCPMSESELRTDTIEAPARIEVPVNIWHELEAVTDCSFIELNTLQDVKRDSIRIWRADFLAGQRTASL